MRISKLTIYNFRLFNNDTFFIGNYLTIFSGTNAVGKSTLLGILGNSSELKTKDGRPILQKQFRTEFSEVFKMSPDFDKSASNVLTVFFDDDDSRKCRITWQKKKNDPRPRPRIIPEYIDSISKKRHSQKKNWPTLFLGLSRLYPFGESDTRFAQSKKYIDATPELTEKRNSTYKKILSIMDNIKETKTVSIQETSRKKVFGITTEKYDYLTNSAGQDNLGQILLAVDSFRLLKENQGEKYCGGLLLIDEIDATLHPSAQNRLIDYLYREAKKLDLQIVCTTHSLSLLNYISQKTEHNVEDNINNIELYYLSIANNTPNVEWVRNPKYGSIQSLLLEEPQLQGSKKASILTEDEEARWFIKNIIKGTCLENSINLLPMTLGKNSILSLIEGDPLYAYNKIIILDGDVSSDTATMHKIEELLKNKLYNIILLPGKYSPEAELDYFLKGDSPFAAEYFSQDRMLTSGIVKSVFFNDELTSNENKNRDNYKKWFKKYNNTFDSTNLFEFYRKENKTVINEFIQKLENRYTILAKRLLLPKLNSDGQ